MTKAFDLFNPPENQNVKPTEESKEILDYIQKPTELKNVGELKFNKENTLAETELNSNSISETKNMSETWKAYLSGILESRSILVKNYEEYLQKPFILTIWCDGNKNCYPIPKSIKNYLMKFGEEKDGLIKVKDIDSLVELLRIIEPYNIRKNVRFLNVLIKIQEIKKELKQLSSDDMEIIEA